MKQGKNKPLEADEVDFLDAVAAHHVEAERRKRADDAQELESFQVLPRCPCRPSAPTAYCRVLSHAQLMREQALVKKAVERPHVAVPPPQVVTTVWACRCAVAVFCACLTQALPSQAHAASTRPTLTATIKPKAALRVRLAFWEHRVSRH